MQDLDEAERAGVLSKLSEFHYAPRSQIFAPGESSSCLYIVKTGKVRLFHISKSGEEFTLGTWVDGHIIGLLSSILEEKRFLFAECVSATTLLVLSRPDLLKLMETIPRFSFNIALLIARMASHHLAVRGEFAVENARVRLGKMLLSMASSGERHPGKDGASQITSITQAELARMVGVSRPWVNQILTQFERSGHIKRSKSGLLIHDPSAFARALEQDDA